MVVAEMGRGTETELNHEGTKAQRKKLMDRNLKFTLMNTGSDDGAVLGRGGREWLLRRRNCL